MQQPVLIRPVQAEDYDAWRPLWDGYNAFYGRVGASALPGHVTATTWRRFFEAGEPVFALVAERGNELVGLTHYVFHRSTTRVGLVCYLQDLFTAEAARGAGIGRALILAVYERAKVENASRVYWQTQATNLAGRALYDKVASHLGFVVYSHELPPE